MTDARGQIRPDWSSLGVKIQRWGSEERSSIATAALRMIEDLGTTFNVYSDVGCAGQPYELDPIPLLIPPADWVHVAAGLTQRMRLIDAVLADNADAIEEYRDGDDKLRKKKRGFLMGEVMKASKGSGNPQVLNRLLDERLN